MKKRFLASAAAMVAGLGLGAVAAAQQSPETASGEPAPAESATAASTGAPASDAVQPDATIPVAQEPEPAAPRAAPRAERNDQKLEEIIVTAQRREERAQDVPISITVFDQEQLSKANMTSASDLAIYTPSLTTNQRFGPDQASFAIRGFTQDLRTTASVGVYFAEVVAPRGASAQTTGDGAGPGDLFDLANVQILKGPQGTLFGRNTTGGAVLLAPNKPTDQFEGYAEVSGGDFEMRRVQAVLNVPVTSWFMLRLGVDRSQREGHLLNYTHIAADRLGDVNYTAARLSAVLNLGDSLENYTILSYLDSNSRGYSSILFACNPSPLPTSNLFYAFTGQQCQTQLANQAATGHDGFYDMASTVPTPITTIKQPRLINTTTWNVSDGLILKNIVAYAHLRTLNSSDLFGTQFHATYDPDQAREYRVGTTLLNPTEPVTSQATLVEEIQVQGQTPDTLLQWQAGAYYEHSRPDGFSGYNVAGFISCQPSTLEGDPSQFNCFDPFDGQVGSVLTQQYKTDYLNKALYAQATYQLIEQLSLTAGIRSTWDRASGVGIKTVYAFVGTVEQAPRVGASSPSVGSHAPTGLIELSYKPVEDVMAYAKYVRGYRQGSVNMTADPGVDTFKAEHVNTYEIGAKTSFEGMVPGRFNVAVFYNDLTDQQLQTGYISPTAGPTTAIFNAGKSRSAGAEVEAYFRLLSPLTLSLSYAYLNTKLLKQDNHQPAVQAAGGPIAGATYTPIADIGDQLPFAPDHTAVATLDYRLPLSPTIGTVNLGITYVYTGEQRAAATSASPYAMLSAFRLLNLNLNWIAIFGLPLDMSLFATNVLDEEYATYVSGTYTVLGFESRMTGLPRMFGARLKYNFGADAP